MIAIEILREVMLENRQEVMRHRVIRRGVSLDGFDRQVLVGVRRAGKSYLLYGKIQEMIDNGHSWDELLYLNFEDERLAGMQAEDLNKILEAHLSLGGTRPTLFLDEIQNIDGWEKFVRRLADNKYCLYITGSNAKMLSTDVAGALGGRFIIREVFPLSFAEYLQMHSIDATSPLLTATTEARAELKKLFEEYFLFGGFPECATMPVKRDYLTSLYQKIFLGDIATRHKIENIFALRVLFRKLSESVKQPLSFTRATQIVNSTGTKIGKSTVINYISYAMDACLILSVQNIADRLADRVSNPKYYFIDNGIISLLTLDARTSLLENMVALKLLSTYGSKDAVYFYNHNIEVDFVLPDVCTAIQVSYSLDHTDGTFERETSALVKLQSRISINRSIIVTYADEGEIEVDGVKIELIPAWKFLLMSSSEISAS